MTTPMVDIRADLQNEDDTGYVWAFLRRATEPARITAGAIVIAGNSAGRSLARVIDIVDGPGDKVVHLQPLPGSVTEHEQLRRGVTRAS